MNFQIPQFIEQKAKIIGPLTLIQFLYLAAAGGLIFAFFYVFNFFLWILFSLVVFVIAVAFAFLKINGQDLPKIFVSAFSFIWRPRIYTWQRAMIQTQLDTSAIERIEKMRGALNLQEKLKSFALSITTGKIFSQSKITEAGAERFEAVRFATGERKIAKRVDY